MNHTPRPYRSRRASVLVGALLVLVILTLVVSTIVLSGGRDAEQVKNRWGQARAYYNAESAAAMALREIADATDHDGDGEIGGVSDDNNDANNPALNGGTLKAVFTDGSPDTITTSGQAIGNARGPVLEVIPPVVAAPRRAGLYLEAWPLTTHALVNTFNWSQTPATVGWVHAPYWPNQSTNNMMYVGQTRSAVRLTGKITTPTAGAYTFSIDVDDDARLLINGTQVLLRNANGGCQRFSGTITLTAGDHDFQLFFTDGGGSGCLMALWTTPGTTTAVQIPPSAFTWAPADRLPSIVTTGTISFSGDGTPATAPSIVAWDGTQGPYSGAIQLANEADLASNATANNTITGYNGSTVNGDLRVGVGGNPNAAIFFNTQATYSGTAAALARAQAVPIHGLPGALPAASPALSLSGSQSLTVNSNRRYPSITLSNQSAITVDGDRTVYVSGAFSMSGDTTVVITNGSVLRLYIDGALNINNQAILNTSQQPGRCYIYLRGSNQTAQLTNTAQLHAHLRNPTGAVNISSNSNTPSIFSGTIAARALQVSNRSQLRLDCGPLGTSGGSSGSGSGLLITGYTDP